MSSRLLQLLIGVLIAMAVGYFTCPLPRPSVQPPPPVATTTTPTPTTTTTPAPTPSKPADEEPTVPTGVVIDDSGSVATNDGEGADDSGDSDGDDDFWDTGDGDDGESPIAVNGEQSTDSYMPSDEPAVVEESFTEDDIPVDPAQDKFAPVGKGSRSGSIRRRAERLAKQFEKEETKARREPFVRQEFTPDRWTKPEQIYSELTERVLAKLGNLDEDAIWTFLEDPANRLDLATLHLINRAGLETIRSVAGKERGAAMLSAVTGDLDWMTGLMYSGPTDKFDKALSNLATLYARFLEDMSIPISRRIATTAALEFAREGWGEKELVERYLYYNTSHRLEKLNVLFDSLQYWEMRLVTGCGALGSWGSPTSLTWQRDNVRLPVDGYLGACNQLIYRLRNVAGDSVFSGEYLAPILKYTSNTTAWAHREIGGVCGACSHYGAYGALAAGLPAMTMGEPGHCAYTVRVNGEWKMSYSIYWEHSMHKAFWGERDWEFLILMQKLYEDRYTTLASDMMAAMGDFLAARRKTLAASYCYEDAVLAQPLNWPAWIRYTSYLGNKDPENAAKWTEVHDHIVELLAPQYHNAAATLLAKYVYPSLTKAVTERRKLNKMFADFFDKCDSMGPNRWDISRLLNAQMATCTTPKEQLAYMRESLKTLMGKPDYTGAVLSWGLDFVSNIKGTDEDSVAMQEEFSELVIKALKSARTTRKDIDATWKALGEAINTAAENRDIKTFQAIGKLAQRKCKKNFPKNKFKFKGFPGKVVSADGLITTSTTLSPGQVPQSCLHWGVLQRTGGSMPCKFEGNCAISVYMDARASVSGVVCLFHDALKKDREYILEASDDGQNWTKVGAAGEVSGAILRFDCRKEQLAAKNVRVRRAGDKFEPTIVGMYVYGKPIRNK